MSSKAVKKSDLVELEEVEGGEEVSILDETEGQKVVTKYKTAGDIANKAIKAVLDACVEGAKVLELCQLGDKVIEDEAKKVYNKGGVLKGIAFPTSVSPQSVVCHLSPVASDPEAGIALKKGDMVRVELGAHVDGYISQVAHTIVVGASKETPVTGKQADVLLAAQNAAEALIRLLKHEDKTNLDATEMVAKIAEDFGCKPVENMLSHSLKRYTLDGPKSIILSPTEQSRKDMEECKFEDGDAWCIDILISSGEGKPKMGEARTTIYKKNAGQQYNLKVKAARELLGDVNKRFNTVGFSLRQFEEQGKARLGIRECVDHGLLSPYTVLVEKEGDEVAHFMYTVLLMPTGPLKITGLPYYDAETVKSDKAVKDDKAKDLLRQGVKKTKPKAK